MNRLVVDKSVIRPLKAIEVDLCAKSMASSEPWITLGRDFSFCQKIFKSPMDRTWVVEYEGRLAGFVIVNLHGPLIGYIQAVWVPPEYRFKGIGRRMVSMAEDVIHKNSPNVFVCASSFNQDAQKFYERIGYTRIGELRDYFVQGHSEWLYRKTIGPWSGYQVSEAKLSVGANR